MKTYLAATIIALYSASAFAQAKLEIRKEVGADKRGNFNISYAHMKGGSRSFNATLKQ